MKKIIAIVLCMIIAVSSSYMPATATKASLWPKGPSKKSITAESAIVMELNTGTILYSKNIHDKHYPASITKIMTTLLCLENSSLTDVVTFSQKAVNSIEYGSSNISIVANEQITMEDCLYGIMLMSANEACNGVAEHIAGDISGFVDMMNEKAESLGCKDTHFANPNGLYMDNHYTSAYDMALIACAAMRNNMFRKITGTKTYIIPKTNLKDARHLYNKHNMLYPITYPRYGYEYCIGGKTGYTEIARWTLVTFAKKGDLELVSVVMKTAGPPRVEPNEYTDTIKLMNYAIENYEKHPLNVDITSENNEGQYSLFTKYNKIFDTGNSPLYVKDSAGVVLPKGVDISEAKKNIEYYKQNKETDEGTAIGKITYTYDGKEAGTAEIYYDSSRIDESELNQNVSKIIDEAEKSNIKDNNSEESAGKNEDIIQSGEEENQNKNTEIKKERKHNNLIWIYIAIITIIIIAVIVFIVYRIKAGSKLRKNYLGKSWKYYNKKNKKWFKKY